MGITVFVTSAGGDLGRSIVKSLRLDRNLVGRCVGTDMSEHKIYPSLLDEWHIVPPADEGTKYLASIRSLLSSAAPCVVIPASEPELRLLSQPSHRKMLRKWGAILVAQPSHESLLWGDKLRCFRRLSQVVPIAWCDDGMRYVGRKKVPGDLRFPLVVKSRRGHGRNHVYVVKDSEEMESALRTCPVPVLQEYLNVQDGEFSIGVFKTRSKCRLIAFRRWIGSWGGSTVRARLEMHPEVLRYAKRIAQECTMTGSFNIQIAFNSQGAPRLLEINPRFSALACCRALCGFNDVVWSIRRAVRTTVPEWKRPTRHLEITRFIGEVVRFGEDKPYKAVEAWQ